MIEATNSLSARQRRSDSERPDLHGIIPYLVTPVSQSHSGLSVRTDVLADMSNHLIESGVHGLAPLGSTGEFAYLSTEQRIQVVETVVRVANGRVPVVPCVGGFSTAAVIEEAQAHAAAGVDALVVILQEYFPLGHRQMVEFFTAVADAVDLPICIYTNPGLLGNALPIPVIQELSQHPRIQYIKDASTNTGRILSIVRACGDDMKVFSASAHVPMLVLELGGVGWMGGPAAVAPRECLRLYELALAGDWTAALKLQHGLWELNEAFSRFSPAASMKAALTLQGFDVGDPIAPQIGLQSADLTQLGETLTRVSKLLPATDGEP